AISITDANKTPDINVYVYKADTDELLLRGRTNVLGIFRGTVQVRRYEEIRIKFYKQDIIINPSEFVSRPLGRPLTVSVTITGKQIGIKEIIFKVKTSLPDIEIIGINENGRRISLGKTDRRGILKSSIKKTNFQRISFRYSLEGAEVFSDEEIPYSFNSVPKTINLKAIPDKDLSIYFHCTDEFLYSDIEDVYISSENISEIGITDTYGSAFIRVHPDRERGPFIEDTLRWKIEKDNYSVFKTQESLIKVGQFIYPEYGINVPYNFTLARGYKMRIRVLEDSDPVPDVDIIVNKISYKRTDESGNVFYTYYGKDINKKVTFDVKKEGLSASPQTITLGKIERSLTFNVRTIHVFLRFVDSTTDELITGLTVIRDGEETGEPAGIGRVKLIFPEIGSYKIGISDKKKAYLEKTHSLSVTQITIGNEYTVEIDPKTGISFSLIDTSGNALEGVHIFRDSKEVGTTDKEGRYAEDYDPDPHNYFIYSFTAEHYLPVEKKIIYRKPGRTIEEIKLMQLSATIVLKDEHGNPAPYVDVYMDGKVVGQSNDYGEFRFSPNRVGDYYSMEFVSPDELYETTEHELYFAHNDMKQDFPVIIQHWIELNFFEPGGLPLSGVQVTSSTGKTGKSDTLGIFPYKVLTRFEPVDFSFSKPGFEKTSAKVIPQDVVTVKKIPVPRLQAYFYVVDSRTSQPVRDLQVSVNGVKQTFTDFNGKANIFPSEKPSDIEIYIEALDGIYIPLKKTVKYIENNLGHFEIDKRPIEIRVGLRWNNGAPVRKGTVEIDMPYEKHKLSSKDNGKHTFYYYNRSFNPNLTIKAQTPTGQPFTREQTINIPPDPSVYSVDVPLILEPRPTVEVLVDEGVMITIIQGKGNDETVVVTDHDGNYLSQLPDFGEYTIVRSGEGFTFPDSTFFIISQSQQTIDLTRQPLCAEAQTNYSNGNWNSFIDKVNQLTINDNCYCEMNKKAGEVSMDNLNDYKSALEFYKRITYSTPPCVIGKDDPKYDPFIHLRMLECCVESQQYEEGIREADKFDELIILLPPDTKAQAICKKKYLKGLLMVDEYWSLCKRMRSVGLDKAEQIKAKLNELRKDAIQHLETHEKTRGSCPSLQVQLGQVKGGC
nr:hypothetical protein [Bacteroidota bacterium]